MMVQQKKDYSFMSHAASSSYSQSALSVSSKLAWLYVGVLSLSYALCTVVLHKLAPVDAGLWDQFTQQVPTDVFQWQLAAFGGVLLLNIINLVFCSTPIQYNCNVLLVLIHSVAFATDWLIEERATSLVMSWSGRMFLPLRYVQWMHTTPTMILLMSMLSDLPQWRITAAVVGDLVMVVTGLGASWTSGPLQWVLLVLSFGGFAVVISAIIDIFRGAMQESSADATSKLLLGRMLGLTLVVWSLFPVVWLAAHAGYLSMTFEQVFWGVSDYGAKVVFSSHLWQKNLATVQQRREAAQELMGVLDRGLLIQRVRGLVASKDRLVYALSHELRAPINGMLALVQELLYNKTQSAASRTKMLMMIRSSATCLLNTIDATLNGNGDGADGVNSQGQRPHKVQLWRVCESVLKLTRPMVKEHVRLINCISRDMPPVKGDSARLMQVLMNLVCTCLKFTHVGDIKISASQTHSSASIVVADNGEGIPPQHLATALRPFDQDGDGPADVWNVCRSGLGLYLVQQALSSMGSSIQATSELGKGSSFRFELPLADDECESESELETDMFSEAGSLRASLEMAVGEYDAGRAARAAAASTDSQSGGSKRPSAELLLTPAASAGGPRSPYVNSTSTGAGSSTGPSSIASGLDQEAATAGLKTATILQQMGQVQGGGDRPMSTDCVSPTASAAGLLPPKPCHRNVKDGTIQVLSVDDDPVNQMVASTALRSHKWDVVKCMSGAEALEHLERSCTVLPDLVLLDVMMPSMSGYEVAARIRQSYPSSLLPIIMVSAKTEEDDIVQGLRCGADDYITKPFKRAELAARIRAHIRARDAFAQQQAAEQAWLMQHNLLPPNVQRKLRVGETVIAESHPCATVLWAEVVGGLAGNNNNSSSTVAVQPGLQLSTAAAAGGGGMRSSGRRSMDVPDAKQQQQQDGESAASRRGSGGLSPAEAVVTLNSLYTTWEELCAQRDVLGVDFSGSTFVAVSGHDDNPQHLPLMIATAEAMLGVAAAVAAQHRGSSLAVRLGLHTGPITTGLVGSKAVKLVLMGDTVEIARHLASSGCPLGLHISAAVYNALGGSSGVAAAAMPWTLQALPGSSMRQHTYLLPSSACAAAAGLSSEEQQQQLAAAAAAASAPHPGSSSSSSGNAADVGAVPAAVHEVSVGRLARFLRPEAAAAAGGVGAGNEDSSNHSNRQEGGAQGDFTSCDIQQQQHAAVATTATDISSSALLRVSLPEAAAPASSSSKLAAATAAGVVTTAALPLPPAAAARGSVGFGRSSSVSSGSRDGRLARTSPMATAVAATAAPPPPSAVSADAEHWLLSANSNAVHHSNQQQQQQHVTAAALAAAAVAHLSHGSNSSNHLEQQQQQQELQACSSALLQQLGEERQQLQQQLLQSVQQCAAATAEVKCLKQQLKESQQQVTSSAALVDNLRQQLGSAVMKAHLADCWRAVATVKLQFGNLLAAGGQMGSQQQQQQRQLAMMMQQQMAALTAGGSPAQRQQQQQVQLDPAAAAAAAPTAVLSSAVPGSPAANGVPAAAAAATLVAPTSPGSTSAGAAAANAVLANGLLDAVPAAASLQQLQQCIAQAAELGVLQQQQQQQLMMLMPGLQQLPGSWLPLRQEQQQQWALQQAVAQLQQQMQTGHLAWSPVAATAAGSTAATAAVSPSGLTSARAVPAVQQGGPTGANA